MRPVARWLAIFCFVSVPAVAAAWDYSPMTLFRLLTDADIVVSGDITNLSEDSYQLAVRRAYRPGDLPEVIQVVRIDTYPVPERWTEYREGQLVFVFADRGEQAGDPIHPLGAAGEGELPIENDMVHVRALSHPHAGLKPVTMPGGMLRAYGLDVDEFDRAIAGFDGCYQAAGARNRLMRICDGDQRDAYRNLNWLASHLAAIAERSIE